MKKIIFATIACLFISLAGYAQISSLDKFFDRYAKMDEFTYIYYGNEDPRFPCMNPFEFRGRVDHLHFVKSLYSKKLREESPEEFLTSLKRILNTENFVLTQKVKSNNKTRTETYQKETDKNIEHVNITVNGSSIQVRWVSGALAAKDDENSQPKPEFIGKEGNIMEYLGYNLKYPEEAILAGVNIRVIYSFVVEKDGSIKDIKWVTTHIEKNSKDPLVVAAKKACEKAAYDIIASTSKQWKPAKKGNLSVSAEMSLPVWFKFH